MRPTIPEALPLIRSVYEAEAPCLGCCFYTVFENGNYALCHVEECLREAICQEHARCVGLGELLLRMSKTQRKRLSRMSHHP